MKQIEADVVVIGAGTAGLPAAITVAEGGASVILFEKQGNTGGSGNRANMVFAVESRLQRLKPPILSKEDAFRAHMDWTHWRVDSRLVKAFYDKSAGTIDWLEKMGVEFQDVRPYSPGQYNTPHTVKGTRINPRSIFSSIGTCFYMMQILTDRARELGVKIYLKTPGKKLLKRSNRIVGVIAQGSSGEEIWVNAKAVIIGSGGFSNNPEMIKQYCGYEEGHDLAVLKVPGLTGDGIRMAWEVGAFPTEIHLGLTHHLPPPYNGPGGTATELRAFSQPTNLMVNLLGERFLPEDLRGGHSTVCNALSIQKERAAFMIFDGDTKKYYDETLPLSPDLQAGRPRILKHDNLDDNIKEAQGRGYKYLFVADSLADLCTQTGIDLEGLRNTIAEYNKACETGRDELFNKDPKNLRPIRKPKFYAGKFIPGAYGTVGGLKINDKAEVLDKELKAIPGLYAAGNDANTIYDTTYVPLAGNFMGFAVNTGRIAAESALEFIKSLPR